MCNFADNNTLYSIGKNTENVISDLKTDLVGVLERFKINSLKTKPSIILEDLKRRMLKKYCNNLSKLQKDY